MDVPPRVLPHDPAVSPDGALWFTGQRGNIIGRVDPKTGELKEYTVKVPGSGPDGLVADQKGNIWFTANSKAYIGKPDPLTGEIQEYPMPDPRARDPHTPIFDQRGNLWFTVQGGNIVGRLDITTGVVALKEVPTPRCRPYGIVVNSAGIPEGARPRRLTVSRDDLIYYSDYARGYLGATRFKDRKRR
jgi:virginiamycin B lyase